MSKDEARKLRAGDAVFVLNGNRRRNGLVVSTTLHHESGYWVNALWMDWRSRIFLERKRHGGVYLVGTKAKVGLDRMNPAVAGQAQ